MRAWLRYAAATGVVVVVGAVLLGLVLGGRSATAIGVGAGLAWLVQLVAFGLLLRGRRPGGSFVVGWGLGMGLRGLALAGLAWWVVRSGTLPAEPALLGLVGFVFVLVLMEPVFMRVTE